MQTRHLRYSWLSFLWVGLFAASLGGSAFAASAADADLELLPLAPLTPTSLPVENPAAQEAAQASPQAAPALPAPAPAPDPALAPAAALPQAPAPEPPKPVAAKPAEPGVVLVAALNVTSAGMDEKGSPEALGARLNQQIEAAGKRAILPSETESYLQSEKGRAFLRSLSVERTCEAGADLGAQFVLSGDVRQAKDGQIALNLDLFDVAKKQKRGHLSRKLAKGADFGPEWDAMAQELLGAANPGDSAPLVAAKALPNDSKEKEKEPAEDAKEQAKVERFYKGELTTVGPLEIIPWRDRAGLLTGFRQLNYKYYMHIEPQVDLHFFPDKLTREGKLRLGFSVPLNLELYSREDANNDQKIDAWKRAGHVRTEDWDNWRDYFKLIRYIQYGRKEDKVYVNVNRVYAASVGHGEVMKRYIANLDYFNTRLSAEVDAYSDYGGGEFYTNDLTRPNIISALAFLKPASFASKDWMAKSFSIGMHYSTDWEAPKTINEVRQTKDGSYIVSDSTDLHFIGGDIELKVVNWPVERPEIDLKVYTDYTQWLHNGGCWSLGTLGRFNLYSSVRQAFRTRLEFRVFQDNYTPSYFDSFYEIMKFRFFSERHPATYPSAMQAPVKTKYQEYSERKGTWKHAGVYVEFSYALLDYVGVTVAFDRYSGQDNGNVLFHLEVPATKYAQLEASYYKTNVTSAKNVFDPTATNTMFVTLLRIRPIQLLAIQGGVRRITQPSQIYFPALDGIWDFKADLEISWEF